MESQRSTSCLAIVKSQLLVAETLLVLFDIINGTHWFLFGTLPLTFAYHQELARFYNHVKRKFDN
jgi:hypothetical protein